MKKTSSSKPLISWEDTVRFAGKYRYDGIRAALLIIYVLLLFFLSPQEKTHNPINYSINNISKDDIIAKTDFPVLKDSVTLMKEKIESEKKIYPVYTELEEVSKKKSAEIKNILNELSNKEIGDSVNMEYGFEADTLVMKDVRRSRTRDSLLVNFISLFNQAYYSGVCRNVNEVRENSGSNVITVSNGGEKQVVIENLFDEKILIDSIQNRTKWYIKENPVKQKFIYNLTLYFFEPNLIYNETYTTFLKEKARNSISITKGYVKKGEKIVGKHERITPEIYQKLISQRIYLENNDINQPRFTRVFLPNLARFLMILALICFFWYMMYYLDSSMIKNFKYLSLIIILTVLPLAIYSVIAMNARGLVYLAPIPVFIILISVLINHRIGMLCSVYLSIMIGVYMNLDFRLFLLFFIVLLTANYSVIHVRHRRNFYRSMLLIPFAFVFVIFSLYINDMLPEGDFSKTVVFVFINGLFSPIIANGLLPVFESMFAITTDLTMLELSDFNHPLLQRLAVETPGTFNHSLQVGYLAEAAAKSIKANSLKARVGSYYHDIGKLNKPDYFIENQGSENKHDNLSPHMSALILSNHVREGVELAKRYRLPYEIIQVIEEHHGTTVMEFFYEKAKQKENGEHEFTESDFQYPGPKPRSKESVIVMLADSVEAASRTLKSPTVSSLRNLTEKIFQNKIKYNQLSNSIMTLEELELIKDSFVKSLAAKFHSRVEYPEGEQTTSKEENNAAVSE